MSAWYIATCVNAPAARDVADRPHAVAGAHPVVDVHGPGRGVEPDGGPARARRGRPAGRWRPATRSPAASPPSDSVTVNRSPSCRDLLGLRARADLDALAAEHLGRERADDSGSSSASRRSSASTTVTSTPKRANTWASSSPTAPPPSTSSESGSVVGLDGLAVGPVGSLGEPVDRRDHGRRCRCAMTTARVASNSRSPTGHPTRPGRRAHVRGRSGRPCP